ncbi:hypothetical protein TRFO_15328 [Tritrichomonas foetus]|uniref:Uncharacterized protein n=1 Tax=Tritrichomonas foetus TaxID=1144522 RepID=A0A1J4KSN8_9EUKA|nr:hypothetical protein TRFO_15328 [Tritrichomonas foetus]|eukprot:OHT14305.1 hypothetical protein TRFO_15328 [Tritrichomonas foetus]
METFDAFIFADASPNIFYEYIESINQELISANDSRSASQHASENEPENKKKGKSKGKSKGKKGFLSSLLNSKKKKISQQIKGELSEENKLIVEEADNGNCDQLLYIARSLIENLNGFPSDIQTGISFLNTLVHEKHVPAIDYYGKLLYLGHFVPQDIREAKKLLHISYKLGSCDAAVQLGTMKIHCEHPDYHKAARYFLFAANENYPEGLFQYAMLLKHGNAGSGHSPYEASAFFHMAADNGHPYSCYVLGMMYRNGDTVTMSRKDALKYLNRALELGIKVAQKVIDYLVDDAGNPKPMSCTIQRPTNNSMTLSCIPTPPLIKPPSSMTGKFTCESPLQSPPIVQDGQEDYEYYEEEEQNA